MYGRPAGLARVWAPFPLGSQLRTRPSPWTWPPAMGKGLRVPSARPPSSWLGLYSRTSIVQLAAKAGPDSSAERWLFQCHQDPMLLVRVCRHTPLYSLTHTLSRMHTLPQSHTDARMYCHRCIHGVSQNSHTYTHPNILMPSHILVHAFTLSHTHSCTH